MTGMNPQPWRALFVRATVLLLALLVVAIAGEAAAEQEAPPKAGLQDVPDLVIFNTGEVKGALVPGG